MRRESGGGGRKNHALGLQPPDGVVPGTGGRLVPEVPGSVTLKGQSNPYEIIKGAAMKPAHKFQGLRSM